MGRETQISLTELRLLLEFRCLIGMPYFTVCHPPPLLRTIHDLSKRDNMKSTKTTTSFITYVRYNTNYDVTGHAWAQLKDFHKNIGTVALHCHESGTGSSVFINQRIFG